jgi:hypothetical protein
MSDDGTVRTPNSQTHRPEIALKLGVHYWSLLPLEVIEHYIGLPSETGRCYFAILRCSWMFPHRSEIAVRPKLRKGTFEGWADRLWSRIGKHRPVGQRELDDETCEMAGDARMALGVTDLAKITSLDRAHCHRALRELRRQGLLAEGLPLRLVAKPDLDPSAVDPEDGEVFTIAGLRCVVPENALPGAREALEHLRYSFNSGLRALRTEAKLQAKQLQYSHGILIENRVKDLKSEVRASQSPNSEAKPAGSASSLHSSAHSHSKPGSVPESSGQPSVAEVAAGLTGLTFGAGASDPARARFDSLPRRFGLPLASVCQCLGDKVEQLKKRRYTLDSLGAFLTMIERDIEKWAKANRRAVEIAAEIEERDRVAQASLKDQVKKAAAAKGLR